MGIPINNNNRNQKAESVFINFPKNSTEPLRVGDRKISSPLSRYRNLEKVCPKVVLICGVVGSIAIFTICIVGARFLKNDQTANLLLNIGGVAGSILGVTASAIAFKIMKSTNKKRESVYVKLNLSPKYWEEKASLKELYKTAKIVESEKLNETSLSLYEQQNARIIKARLKRFYCKSSSSLRPQVQIPGQATL